MYGNLFHLFKYAKLASLKIFKGLVNLRLCIHYKWAITHDRFINGFTT